MTFDALSEALRLTQYAPVPDTVKMRTVSRVYASDVLSDVLEHAPSGAVLLTLQSHPAVIGIAFELHLPAIILPHGRVPPPETTQLAQEHGIALFSTPASQFEVCATLARLDSSLS